MRLEAKPSFLKATHKLLSKQPTLRPQFENTLRTLQTDSFIPSLKTHRLKGSLKEFHACSVAYDVRIIFRIESDILVLIDIGSHDEVY